MKTIEEYTFANCTSLTSITLGNGITKVCESAFLECSKLSSVNIFDIAAWCNIQFVNSNSNPLSKAHHLFFNDVEVKDLVIPEGVSLIKTYSFSGCNELTKITLPTSVLYINGNAFTYCSSLHAIDVLSTTPPFLNDNSFSDYSVPVKVPKGCKEAYQSAQGWKNFTNISDTDKYNLIYKVDNEIYKSYEIEEGVAITPEANPVKDGYTFSGWSEIPATMPAHDVTVTGSFTVNQYTITYMIDDEVYTTQTVDYGSTIVPPAASEREGYDFAWGDYPETMPAHDITIYGIYNPKTQQCAKPTIKYIGGKLKFDCETEGVTYHYVFTTPSGSEADGNNIKVPTSYNVSVYAKKDGYLNSEIATQEIDVRGIQGDVNQDGKVTITDAVGVVNIILDNGGASAPAIKTPDADKSAE